MDAATLQALLLAGLAGSQTVNPDTVGWNPT